MGVGHERRQKVSVTNLTLSRIAMQNPELLLAEHHLNQQVAADNLNQQHKLWGEEERVALNWSCPQDRAICHPQSHHALDSSQEKRKSKRKTWRWTVQKEMWVDRVSWGCAKDESERQTAVAVSDHGLMHPRARRGLGEWLSDVIISSFLMSVLCGATFHSQLYP